MEAEDLALDHGSEGKVVKQLSELLPHIGIAVFPQALVVEAIAIRIRQDSLHLGDLSALMVSSQDGESVSIPDLEGNQQGHCLNRVVASIHVVSHEQIVGLWG